MVLRWGLDVDLEGVVVVSFVLFVLIVVFGALKGDFTVTIESDEVVALLTVKMLEAILLGAEVSSEDSPQVPLCLA